MEDLKSALKAEPINQFTNRDEIDIAGFDGVSTDSRKINKGDLFFALIGEKFDGHDFLNQAVAAGAAGVVVSRDFVCDGAVVLKVDDTLKALGELAKFYRRKFDLQCLALTGSNGKTTTKEMLAACVGAKYKTFKTIGNFNNLIGLPLSIFKLDLSYEAAVLELGMSAPGEITRLAEISQPQIGVFTNIAPVHLESMGSIEAVAKAKYELIESLPAGGAAIVNADDKILSTWIDGIKQRVITYGIENAADFKVKKYATQPDGKSVFIIDRTQFMINFPGKHNIYNAACAIAAASALNIEMSDLLEPLANLKPYHLRSEVFKTAGVMFINDCYNANPASMKSAIDVLAAFPTSGRSVAVLGDMLELGSDEVQYHKEIGEYLSLEKIDALFTFGPLSHHYHDKFLGKFKSHFDNKMKLTESLRKFLKPDDVVLIKGSRGIALEEISSQFKGEV